MTAPTAEDSRALLEPLTGYTPGPWDASGLIVYDTCMDGVASCHANADARLIAAAPDLVTHLRAALDREAVLIAERDAARAAVLPMTRAALAAWDASRGGGG